MRRVGLKRVDLLADVAAVAEALRGGEAALQRRAVAARETTCGDSETREEGGGEGKCAGDWGRNASSSFSLRHLLGMSSDMQEKKQ